VKNRVFFANEKKATSPKEICWVQPFIAANKTKLN
jgi:hypothetical protein